MKTPIDMMFDSVEWTAVPPPSDNQDGLPYPTHQGELRIGEDVLNCYVLNTGQRIFDKESLERFFGSLPAKEECHEG